MAFKLSTRSLDHMFGVDAKLIRLAHRAIETTKIDFGIPDSGGVRSDKVQYGLYAKGASKCDGKRNRSKHQDGIALDFYAYVNGAASWDEGDLAQVAAAFLQASIELNYPIQWGGLFRSFIDQPHIELI
jgi:peptidoglycan L-alanyl-D-glutamate endopeptidase CwlK